MPPDLPHVHHRSHTMDLASLVHPHDAQEQRPAESAARLKRRAEDDLDDGARKRMKEHADGPDVQTTSAAPAVDGQALADDLEQELQCGCCAALVYRPVIVAPCQHFFCGR